MMMKVDILIWKMESYFQITDSQLKLNGNTLPFRIYSNNLGENHEQRKIYPWNGSSLRNNTKQNQGQIMK